MWELLKDIGEIWTRLFDHRAFLSGEKNFTLEQFEQKRGDKEVEYLFLLLEQITDLKATQIVRFKNSTTANLSCVNKNLSVAQGICKRIEDIELKYKEDTTIIQAEEERKLQWEKFVDDMARKCERVDNTFVEKEEDLHEFYVDLERKLQISN